MNILPAKYDEAQERLEELRDRLGITNGYLTHADSVLVESQRAHAEALRVRNKAQREYIAHLEKMVSEAAAEKAVRGV